ncbi:MAG: BlaI/MecI/CopY family transcriptional regulator [Candidatus Sericytochromatia bacterium]|uniref:BlaI/MecI/CopY family transcriptional regulator n=1 Tax=Candidatus Tanganyikabacteria bacterium TaxID=2961651 RepID=A0A937X4W3_9BACT|nr:BlaI/MecI/CopY family transcriptional regulator [Candidatus Tanganyikabacteria bacterium]
MANDGDQATAAPDITVFRTGKPGLRKVLGDLEADIMTAVWNRGAASCVTVRDILGDLQGSRGSAYTTVMTVMGVLVKKGLLVSHKAGLAHQYQATCTEAEFTDAAVGRVVRELLADFSGPALAHFSQAIDPAQGDEFWLERIRDARAREGT